MKIIAEIPARFGSKRVKNKNLRLLNGSPMITYSINAAKEAKLINKIYVNTENDELGKIAINSKVDFYKRDKRLAEDDITSDEFNYDFMKNIDCNYLVMINPVSPLITGSDIDSAVNYYFQNKLDTLISIREEQLQAFHNNKPINFDPDKKLPMTQNILPVQLCSWAICIWKKDVFMKSYEKYRHAVFSGNYGFYKLNKIKSLKISEEIDFKMAEIFLNMNNNE